MGGDDGHISKWWFSLLSQRVPRLTAGGSQMKQSFSVGLVALSASPPQRWSSTFCLNVPVLMSSKSERTSLP